MFRAEFNGNSYVATIVLPLSGPPAWWDWLVLALRRWTLHPCCRWYKLGQLLEMERPAFQVLRIASLTRGLHLPSFPSFTGLTPSSRSKPAPRRLVTEDSLPRPKSPARQADHRSLSPRTGVGAEGSLAAFNHDRLPQAQTFPAARFHQSTLIIQSRYFPRAERPVSLARDTLP